MKILVTGGARRVGRMLVEKLAANGHQLAIHCNHSLNDARQLCHLLEEKSSGHVVLQENLGDLTLAEKFIDKCQLQWGHFDVLINCASTYNRRGMTNIGSKELEEDYRINFMAPFLLMQNYFRVCPGGQIINILDKRVDLVEAAAGPYALAKKSLRDATEACAQEWGVKMRVNAVAPGEILAGGEEFSEMTPLLQEVYNNVNGIIEGSDTGQIVIL